MGNLFEATLEPEAPDESPLRGSSTPAAPVGIARPAAVGGYDFLLASGLSTAALVEASDTARQWGVSLPEVLISRGVMSEAAYTAAVAAALGVAVAEDGDVIGAAPLLRLGRYGVHHWRRPGGDDAYAIVATTAPLPDLLDARDAIRRMGATAIVAAPRVVAAADERRRRSAALRQATFGLRRSRPDLSASRPPAGWLVLAFIAVFGLFAGAFMVSPGAAVVAVLLAMALPFVGVVVVRCAALLAVALPATRAGPDSPPIPDDELPIYTVLVPLYDEADVVPGLVASLSKLDYPAAKLDLVLVLEEADVATKLALLGGSLPPNLSVSVVPDGKPRTKPRALNYAIQFARGDFIVVYDAEDRPEPDQLRKAIAAFRTGPINLACVQARLNLYNPKDGWIARQFTIEYSALFDAILPALAWLRLPVPLGGTSNHFPRALLDAVGGWDPYNVTEDADLGIRLARLGYVTDVLDSTTWEEAPVTWVQWKPQRTRWLKGWYQTWLVHMRHPFRLLRELGLRQTIGFHLFLGGIILSTLVHPLFYVMMAWIYFTADTSFELPRAFDGWLLWSISGGTLLAGYFSAVAVGVVASWRRGNGLVLSALQMPLCWLLVSVAAYRALWQLWKDPFLWEKTAHGRSKTTHTTSQG